MQCNLILHIKHTPSYVHTLFEGYSLILTHMYAHYMKVFEYIFPKFQKFYFSEIMKSKISTAEEKYKNERHVHTNQ